MFVSLGGNCHVATALRDTNSPRVASPFRTIGTSLLGATHILNGDANPGYSKPWLFPLEKLDASHQGFEFGGVSEVAMRYNISPTLSFQERHAVKFPTCYLDTAEVRQHIGKQQHHHLTAVWQSQWSMMINTLLQCRERNGPICFCWCEHWPVWYNQDVFREFHGNAALRYNAIDSFIAALARWCQRCGLNEWWLIAVTCLIDYKHPALIGPRIVTAQSELEAIRNGGNAGQWKSLILDTAERMYADA